MTRAMLEAIGWLASACIALGVGCCTAWLARVKRLPRPLLGRRGFERARALASPILLAFEPPIAFAAACVARLPLERVRRAVAEMLARSGNHLGLCADELLALSALTAVGCGAGATLAAGRTSHAPIAVAIAIGVGAALPFERVRNRTRVRNREIARQLPPTIDLLALCMNAGLDFVPALELVVRELRDDSDALRIELRQTLSELAMGHSRGRALANLALRIRTRPVEEFCAAVTQAEQAGTPLASVLAIQARMLRMRRSVAAEEAAARASVLLALPMMLLLLAIVLVMIGPFIVNGVGL